MTRNVVMVSIDSLRSDRCGFLGGKELTPSLDEMATEGVTFTNAIAPGPKTPESMPAVFTGRQWQATGEDFDLSSWHEYIRPHMEKRASIAEQMSRRGYETIAFTPNGFTTEFFGFDEGFDHFEDFLDDELRPGFDIPNVIRGLIKFVRKEGNWKTWERYYEDVLERVENASEPYFLWVFLLDVHSPYLVPRAYRTENSFLDMMRANWGIHGAGHPGDASEELISAYDDTVRYADDFIERITADLSDTDPVYLVHSDHGEAFGEHGYYGHEELLYSENLQVPFLLGNTEIEDEIERPVSLTMIPTLLEAVATDTLSETLAALDRDPWRNPVVAHTEEGRRAAIRVGPLKFITNPEDDPELYDLREDPDERSDLAADRSSLLSVFEEYHATITQARAETATLEQSVAALTDEERL